MRLFITGGTGFIGSHFVKQALAAGHEVSALRRSPTSKPRIPLEVEPTWIDAQLDLVASKHLEGCDAIVHLAAHTPNVPYDTLDNCLRWNLLAPLELFRTAISVGIDRFVVAGSCFEYGLSGERYEFIPPDAPLLPTMTYPASKAAASIAFCQLAIEYNLRLSIHRIFQAYGEGETETRFWPSLKRAATNGEDFLMSTGEQIRDFIHVDIVASKLLHATNTMEVIAGMPYVANIGSGLPLSLKEFAEQKWHELHATGSLRIGALRMRENEVLRYVPQI